jgi:hypothetical protein
LQENEKIIEAQRMELEQLRNQLNRAQAFHSSAAAQHITKPNIEDVSSHKLTLQHDSPKPEVPSRMVQKPPPPPPRTNRLVALPSPPCPPQNGGLPADLSRGDSACQLQYSRLPVRNVLEESLKGDCDERDDSGRESDDTWDGSERTDPVPATVNLLSNNYSNSGSGETQKTMIKYYWTECYF